MARKSCVKFDFDRGKFTELLLYVAARLIGDPAYGSIKLNKVLFFSDFFHYANYGKPITGAEYVKHPLGPAPRGIVQIQNELIASGDADLAMAQNGARAQKMLFPKREANVAMFSGTEIAQVEHILNALSDVTGMQASNLSHTMLAWQITPEREVIPYETVFLYDGPITEADTLRAKELENELGSELSRVGVAAI
jgi:hypothetical protein